MNSDPIGWIRLGEAWNAGEKSSRLPPKAVEVLAELVKRPGEVVGKKELMETVWPETFVEEANLNQMVFLLRRALECKQRERIHHDCAAARISV